MRPLLLLSLLALAACASTPRPATNTPRVAGPKAPPGVKIGAPYVVFGQTYVPADDRSYDARGIASWYGPGFHAKLTANGETYDQDDVTAAHKTLPMPSWVEVTNLDNGRVLTVRVNDRGPFVDGRIIDLSRRSAQLLGVDKVGLAKVRVRRVFPPESAAFTPPAPPAPVIAAPPPVVAAPVPPVVATPLPASPPATAATAGLFIQVAALQDAGRASWLAAYLAPFGTAATSQTPSGLWRVRLGPYASASDAADALGEVQAAGYPDARIVKP
ncbi:septal ring lytic transglycosylase RlpA family protein [Sandaracinobacteroides saxicola]|uniref:septal ring lytic transglycosylase RlpA family protein n=1 Tax=Sandaracinobacteroides saxicola TaxID=2759707 RepID=UPI001FB188C7|nr:septal ring lytic transglycosylase RlpA family protein [Sandaracinobacteroides saxicola]